MAKDPAFLFYSSDFLTGTMFLTDEQVGKYIRLLCAQHQKGHLSEEDMMKICKTYDKHIFSKFERDSDGLYYNVRLEEEDFKRKQYCESRSKNRKLKPESNKQPKNISDSYVQHMENEDENKDIHTVFGIRLLNTEKDKEDIETSARIKFSETDVKDFNAHCGAESKEHLHYSEYKRHFRNWLVKRPDLTKPPPKQTQKGNTKPTAEDYLRILTIAQNGNNAENNTD